MKRWISKVLLCAGLMVGLSGCMLPQGTLNADEAILGTWSCDDSFAVYEISRADDGSLEIRGHSSQSGREMIVSDISWDGAVLKFVTYMPATNHTADHVNRLLGKKKMISEIVENGRVAKPKTYKK